MTDKEIRWSKEYDDNCDKTPVGPSNAVVYKVCSSEIKEKINKTPKHMKQGLKQKTQYDHIITGEFDAKGRKCGKIVDYNNREIQLSIYYED
jgi:hypothetical protein